MTKRNPKPMSKPVMRMVKSLRDLQACCGGPTKPGVEPDKPTKPERWYRQLAAIAVRNLGAEHLRGYNGPEGWEQNIHALETYLFCLVSEYGQDDCDAEQSLIDEINFCRDCVDPTTI